MQPNETKRWGRRVIGKAGPAGIARFTGFMPALIMLLALMVCGSEVQAQQEKRFGLVIGNSEYPNGPVPTSANDAGLIAQTLQASGFDVMGARDLDGDALRNTFRDFVDKVSSEGPGAVAFIYLAGHGVQYEGENYFVPVDARIDRDVDVPLRALRLNDYVRPLGALKAKAVIVVLDAAREAPFARSGQPLAGGLALVEPAPGMLWAFNAAPGTISPMGQPPYGPYAQALAEMMREGGLSLEGVFERTRLRVHEATSGGEVPWHASQVRAPFVFFERSADAPPEISHTSAQARRERPIRAFDDAREAYLAALERDTLDGYADFLRAYPDHALAKRVRAIVAARREAITWRRARNSDRPEAYWSYLDRYPNGPHAPDARRRLAFLTAPIEPPPRYAAFDYDVPPPPPDEIIFVRRPYVYFADPDFGFVAPPPPPLFFLPPRPRFFRPPPPPMGVFLLPVPAFVPVPVYVRPPVYVAPPPPNNVVFRNLHNAPPPQQQQQQAITPPGGGGAPAAPGSAGPSAGTIAAGVAAGALIGAAAATVALPPSVQRRPGALPPGTGGAPGTVRPPVVSKTGVPATPGAALPVTGGAGPLGKGPVPLTGAPGTSGITGAAGAKTPTLPPSNALPGAPTGAPLPKAATGTPSGVPTGVPPGAPLPKSATGTPSGVPTGLQPGAPLPKSATGTPPGAPAGKAPGLPPGAPLPKSATGTPPPPPALKAPVQSPIPAAPVAKSPSPPQSDPRVRAQQDRAAAEAKLLQDRQRDLDRRRQEQEAQQKARQQNQLQDLQKQRQQQMDAQRKAMEQQRQQQQAQQAAAAKAQAEARARAAQQQQAAQAAAARAQAEAQARARAAQQQQQQAAQAAAARAQAEAQARAKAAQQQKKCGAPGLPACPK